MPARAVGSASEKGIGLFGKYMIVAALGGLSLLAACGGGKARDAKPRKVSEASLDCMTRAMYFESNRSSRDGMIAVGTVVMNRVASDAFPNTVCGVVSQKNQFAPGVMSKPMRDSGLPLARASARAVLQGERYPGLEKSMFFHAVWYRANFNNIHYLATAGGNAFYEKRRPENVTNRRPLPQREGVTGR